MSMEIGIIGSGNIGSLLARRFAALEHRVIIANSRGPASLVSLAAEAGVTAGTVEQVARAKDVVILAITQAGVRRLPPEVFVASSAVLVDAGNYYPSRDGQIAEIEAGLAESEWVSRVVGRRVVKAFNNIVAGS